MSTEVTHALDPGAGAQYTDLGPDQSGLVLHLNSITLVITGTPDPQGDRLLMDFCVQLARAASVVADEMNLKLHPVPLKLWDEGRPHGC